MPRTLAQDAKATLGANLVEARKRVGWTQGVAAEKAGILRTRLNLWERGREVPGTEGLLRLAITYGCPVDDFLGGVDEEYDAIIERRIPIDIRQHYQTRLDTFSRRTKALVDLLASEQRMHAPTPGDTAAARATTTGKSKATRARKK